MNALRLVALSLLLAGGNAMAAKPPPTKPVVDEQAAQVDAALAGEYQLAGVMETGSGLLLRADGTFEWYFSYGALDLAARGDWSRTGDVVELAAREMAFPPQMPGAKFERMRLRIDGSDLVPAWPWDMDAFEKGGERGRYERLRP